MFTEKGLNGIELASEYGLYHFYNEYLGNFGFTIDELEDNMNKVLLWLMNNPDYVLIYENNEDYNGKNWWLTEKCLVY